MRTTIGCLLAMALLSAPAAGQAFDWSGAVANGGTLEIRGINGGIEAVRASSGTARVRAIKTAEDDDPDDVRIEVVEHAGGVLICAVYPAPPGREPNRCEPDGGSNSVGRNDVRVDFTVEVPAGVRLAARQVNGDIEATGLDSEVDASTVNGALTVQTSRTATARTVNGAIDVDLGRANWSGTLRFSTTNGNVRVALPDQPNVEVTASTVNGAIESDFPLTVSGRFGPKRLAGTIGQGGRTLELSTVNGSLSLIRR